MKKRWMTILCVAVLATGIAAAGAKDSEAPAAGFEALKALEGDWAKVGEDGALAEGVTISYRVTAGGAAVVETLFPGTDHEMITMYHLEGGELALTHYCIEGNRPHMLLKSHSRDELTFECAEGAELDVGKSRHMHSGRFTFLGPDRFKTEWRRLNNGVNDYTAGFELVRIGGAAGR